MINLTDIPFEDFPLNCDRKDRLLNDVREAARGFERLGQMGWPGGDDLDKRLMAVWSELTDIWETIQITERHMLDAKSN